MTTKWLLAWWNVVYLLPLGLSLLYAGVYALSGITFGESDVDHDIDVDQDVDVDADADADADADLDADSDSASDSENDSSAGFLSWLGVGRIPLSLVLMLLLMSFGGIGFLTNQIARNFVPDDVIALFSIPTALIGCTTFTRGSSRLLQRFMPLNETYAESKADLLGLSGEALFVIDEQFGMVAVRDRRGNLFQIPCRVDAGRNAIEKGSAVLIVGFDRARQSYTVIPDAISPTGRQS